MGKNMLSELCPKKDSEDQQQRTRERQIKHNTFLFQIASDSYQFNKEQVFIFHLPSFFR